jgi:hypothetical protein
MTNTLNTAAERLEYLLSGNSGPVVDEAVDQDIREVLADNAALRRQLGQIRETVRVYTPIIGTLRDAALRSLLPTPFEWDAVAPLLDPHAPMGSDLDAALDAKAEDDRIELERTR